MSCVSNLSHVSVSIHGELKDCETALNEVVLGLQGHLNAIQLQLREIAMSSDQATGDLNDPEMTDLKNSVEQCDALIDTILLMNNLFDDLIDMADQLAFLPENKAERDWLKAHKRERKILIQARKAEWATQRKTLKKKGADDYKD
jgi:hypothetical protein